MNDCKRPIGIDLFCGAGGMSLGFEQAGFDVIFAVDSDSLHTAIYSRNFPNCVTLNADVSILSGNQIREISNTNDQDIDVLFGGPPCQGFSTIGRRRKNDPRNDLLLEFARLVMDLRPRYFVVENVEGILQGEPRNVVADFLKEIRIGGYSVVLPIKSLDASDFGVPQRRSRVFILGYERGLSPPKYPVPKFNSRGNDQHPTVWEAIGDLPNVDEFEELIHTDIFVGALGPPSEYSKILRCEVSDPEDLSINRNIKLGGLTGCKRTAHSAITIKRFQSTRQGKYEPISRYYRLPQRDLANTLRSGSDKEHGSYTAPRPIHPIYPRCITVREAARLHYFPDWFIFHPTKWNGFRQVGNSVPPRLARAVAQSIMKAIIEIQD